LHGENLARDARYDRQAIRPEDPFLMERIEARDHDVELEQNPWLMGSDRNVGRRKARKARLPFPSQAARESFARVE